MILLRFLSHRHSFWLAGFRPFFTLTIFMGLVMPSIWGLVFSGKLTLPLGLTPMQWHAHEMLFGFAGSVLIGFLLTASKNWVNVRGIHGASLMALVGLWIFERVFIYFGSNIGPIFKHIGLSVFFAASGIYIVSTLLRYRHNDNFKDNYFFVILLGLILVAKNLLVTETYYHYGVSMSVGLFRLAFVVMFERTMPQFMKNTEGLSLYKNSLLNFLIKLLVLISVFQSMFSPLVAATILVIAGLLLFLRWILWRPDIGFKKFGNTTMYFGYLGLVLHLIFEALQTLEVWSRATISLHIFTFLCLGVVVPSMLIRISQGHTGRKPLFFTSDKIAVFLIIFSGLVRLLFPLVFPAQYSFWIMMAGLLWSVAYLILGIRLLPFLFQTRIDGKEH